MAMSEPAGINDCKQNVPNPRIAAEAIEKCPMKNTINGKIINNFNFPAVQCSQNHSIDVTYFVIVAGHTSVLKHSIYTT